MRNIKVREVVEMVALHAICGQIFSRYASTAAIPETAKHIADEWAKLNPEICDKEC